MGKAKPIMNEKKPDRPIRWTQPTGSIPHVVKDRETWQSVARSYDVKSTEYLIFYNFYVYLDTKLPEAKRQTATREVNWYLREYVGCNVSMDRGRNWAFSKSAHPGIIYVPMKSYDFEGDGLVIMASSGVGDTVSVPQYDDSNIMDTLSKGLDIYGMAEMGLGVSEVALPVLLEGGLIVTGIAAAVVAPSVAVGSGHAEALRSKTRGYFFDAYALGLVAAANGATKDYITRNWEWNSVPTESVYREKAETFRKLHNAGLQLGIKQGKKYNTVDKQKLFTLLRTEMNASDRVRFSPRIPWTEWSPAKRKDYYDLTSGMIRRKMLNSDLKLTIK